MYSIALYAFNEISTWNPILKMCRFKIIQVMKQGNVAEAKYGNGVCSGHINLQIKAPSFNPQSQSCIQKWKKVEKWKDFCRRCTNENKSGKQQLMMQEIWFSCTASIKATSPAGSQINPLFLNFQVCLFYGSVKQVFLGSHLWGTESFTEGLR